MTSIVSPIIWPKLRERRLQPYSVTFFTPLVLLRGTLDFTALGHGFSPSISLMCPAISNENSIYIAEHMKLELSVGWCWLASLLLDHTAVNERFYAMGPLSPRRWPTHRDISTYRIVERKRSGKCLLTKSFSIKWVAMRPKIGGWWDECAQIMRKNPKSWRRSDGAFCVFPPCCKSFRCVCV